VANLFLKQPIVPNLIFLKVEKLAALRIKNATEPIEIKIINEKYII
jgi:hypothetical protein